MLTLALERIREAQQLLRRDALRWEDVRHLRLAGRDRAGLVERDNFDAARLLEARRRLEQDAVLRAEAAAHHDGDRCREAERTRAADDEHRNAARQRVANRLPDQEPHDRRHKRDPDDRRDEHAGHFIRDLRDWRFRRRRVGDHLDDLRERRVLADARRAAAEEAGLVDRRGRDRVARRLVRRDALAGQRRFVDRARALEHHAVHWDALARPHNKYIVPLHLFDRHGDLLPVADNGGRLRRELHQAFQCIRRLALRSRFEHFTDRDERQNHRRGLKIEVHHVVHDGVHVAAHLRAGHREQCVGAVHECRRRAKGDQRVHIRRAVPQALEAADEKFLVDDHDDDRQQQLCQTHRHVVVIVEARQRPAPHHVPHREVHQYDQKSDRPDEPPLQRGRRMILERLFVLRHARGLLRHALFARAVARLLHRTDDGLR